MPLGFVALFSSFAFKVACLAGFLHSLASGAGPRLQAGPPPPIDYGYVHSGGSQEDRFQARLCAHASLSKGRQAGEILRDFLFIDSHALLTDAQIAAHGVKLFLVTPCEENQGEVTRAVTALDEELGLLTLADRAVLPMESVTELTFLVALSSPSSQVSNWQFFRKQGWHLASPLFKGYLPAPSKIPPLDSP